MKTALLFLLLSAAAVVTLYFKLDIYPSRGTIDIHLYHSYFVVSYSYVVILLFLFLSFWATLGGIIGTRGRNRFYIGGFVLVTIIISLLAFSVHRSFSA